VKIPYNEYWESFLLGLWYTGFHISERQAYAGSLNSKRHRAEAPEHDKGEHNIPTLSPSNVAFLTVTYRSELGGYDRKTSRFVFVERV